MGLKDTSTIDIAMKPPGGHGLYLVVFDSGDISDELRRYQLVAEKLMSYVEYVASGQYQEQAPDVAREDVTVCVVCKTSPNDVMKQIVSIVSRQQPEVRLPVIIETEQQFFQRTRNNTVVPQNPPVQRTGAAGILSGVRKWFGRGSGR